MFKKKFYVLMVELTLCVAFCRGGEHIAIRETFRGDF